jgi:hypothetical protein
MLGGPSEWDTGQNQQKGRHMSIGAAPATPVVVEECVQTAVKIDVGGRLDALALSEPLMPFRSFLVEHTTERWVVHARAPGGRGEPCADAIVDWQAERRMDASVRIAGFAVACQR